MTARKVLQRFLNSMFNNLESLAGAPGDLDRRKTFISSCQDFATYFNSVSIGLNQIQTDAKLRGEEYGR